MLSEFEVAAWQSFEIPVRTSLRIALCCVPWNRTHLTVPNETTSGDTLGSVPVPLRQKMSVWLKKSIDVCKQTLGVELYENYLNEGQIQLVSLGYLIGPSMKDAWCVAPIIVNLDNNYAVTRIS